MNSSVLFETPIPLGSITSSESLIAVGSCSQGLDNGVFVYSSGDSGDFLTTATRVGVFRTGVVPTRVRLIDSGESVMLSAGGQIEKYRPGSVHAHVRYLHLAPQNGGAQQRTGGGHTQSSSGQSGSAQQAAMVTGFDLVEDLNRLVSVGHEGSMCLFDLSTGQVEYRGFYQPANSAGDSFHPASIPSSARALYDVEAYTGTELPFLRSCVCLARACGTVEVVDLRSPREAAIRFPSETGRQGFSTQPFLRASFQSQQPINAFRTGGIPDSQKMNATMWGEDSGSTCPPGLICGMRLGASELELFDCRSGSQVRSSRGSDNFQNGNLLQFPSIVNGFKFTDRGLAVGLYDGSVIFGSPRSIEEGSGQSISFSEHLLAAPAAPGPADAVDVSLDGMSVFVVRGNRVEVVPVLSLGDKTDHHIHSPVGPLQAAGA